MASPWGEKRNETNGVPKVWEGNESVPFPTAWTLTPKKLEFNEPVGDPRTRFACKEGVGVGAPAQTAKTTTVTRRTPTAIPPATAKYRFD